MEDIRTSARVTVYTWSTSVRSRSLLAQKASYWFLYFVIYFSMNFFHAFTPPGFVPRQTWRLTGRIVITFPTFDFDDLWWPQIWRNWKSNFNRNLSGMNEPKVTSTGINWNETAHTAHSHSPALPDRKHFLQSESTELQNDEVKLYLRITARVFRYCITLQI